MILIGSFSSVLKVYVAVSATEQSKHKVKQEAPLLQRDHATCYISWNLVNCCTAVQNITFERLAVGMTFRVTKGHRNCVYLMGHMSLPISGSNNDTIWHHFRDITTFSVYVTGCDLQKSFVFEKVR